MSYLQTITAKDMRRINRSCILEVIRTESPISRSAIAEKLGVSLPTVMRIVDELIEENLVLPNGEKEWSGGRKRSLLRFNAEGHIVIGVDLGGTKMFAALADLAGNILDEITLPQHGTSGKESYEQIAKMIETLLTSPKLKDQHIQGVGIGAPGVTQHKEGIIDWAPSLNWRNFPLKSKLHERLKLPVAVDNDVNLAALGELWFGAGRNIKNFVLITIGTGIGSGIVINGALYRGAHQASGEIGYMLPGKEYVGQRFDEFGALENLASGNGIAQRSRKALQGKVSPEKLNEITAEDAFMAARDGEEWAVKVIEETVEYLAIAVANVSACFDPELIILGGGVARSADLLIEPILKKLDGALQVPPKIVTSALGQRAAVMGAIANVLHNTADFYIVHKLS